jgi:hypothetical protein
MKKKKKEIEYLDLTKPKSIEPIFKQENNTVFHTQEDFSRFMKIALESAKVASQMINEMFNLSPTQKEELRKTRMTIENAALDNVHRPTFALEVYKESIGCSK